MKSVRLDERQEQRLRNAARARGMSQSEFIRRAIDKACDEVLPVRTLYDLVKDIVDPEGAVPVPPEQQTNDAERHSELFGEIVARKHAPHLDSAREILEQLEKSESA